MILIGIKITIDKTSDVFVDLISETTRSREMGRWEPGAMRCGNQASIDVFDPEKPKIAAYQHRYFLQ